MATTNSIATGVAYADPSFVSVQVGSTAVPVQITSAGVLNGSYATTSAASGDTRLDYKKLFFTSTGSGETLRAYASVTGAGAAAAGTINGAHISAGVDGGTISGAANALRATIGATSAAPGGTLAAIQADTNFDNGVTLPGSAAFIRFTNSGATALSTFFNVPNGSLASTTATATKGLRIVTDTGVAYNILLAAA